jgi:DnaJ-class molecular chaperone
VDYRRILGVGPNATKCEVKAAYRKLARQCHPDVCRGEECGVDFIEVNRAYESLMALQEEQGYSYEGGFGAGPASEDDDPWAEFVQTLKYGTHEELQVDYSSYYSNLKCYGGSKARRSKNGYTTGSSSQYYQGNW